MSGAKKDQGKPAALFNYNIGKCLLLKHDEDGAYIYWWLHRFSLGHKPADCLEAISDLLLNAFSDLKLASSVSECYLFGASKYGRDNYVEVELSRYASALVRHLDAYYFNAGTFKTPEDHVNDEESGIHHIKHAFANVLIMLEILDRKKIDGDYDLFKEHIDIQTK